MVAVVFPRPADRGKTRTVSYFLLWAWLFLRFLGWPTGREENGTGKRDGCLFRVAGVLLLVFPRPADWEGTEAAAEGTLLQTGTVAYFFFWA